MSRYRPYNDRNPIIDTTRPPRSRAGRNDPHFSAERELVIRLTLELASEQKNECYWCGVAMWHPARGEKGDPDDRATFDHKLTASRGGRFTKQNGVAACLSCNAHRGDTPFEEYENWIPTPDDPE